VTWGIQGPSYWRDEAATLAAVHRPFGALVRMLGHVDAVHGAYYMLIWVLVRVAGTGELATRLPSAPAMAAAAAGVSVTGRRLVSPRAGLAAGLVFALLPEVSYFGQDTRPYAMVMALAVTASYLLTRVLDPGGPRRGWLLAYAGCLAALGVANIFSLLIVPAHGITVALTAARSRRRAGFLPLLRGWAAAAGGAVALVSPLIVAGFRQRGQIGWIKPLDAASARTVTSLAGPLALSLLITTIAGAAVVISAAAGRDSSRSSWPPGLLALSVPWLVFPPAVLLGASPLQPVYTFRYILFCIPAVALLAGAALAALGRAAGIVALALILLPGQIAERGPGGHGDDIRGIDRIVAARQQPGDGVYYVENGARTFAFAYSFGLSQVRDVALNDSPVTTAKLIGRDASGPQLRRDLSGPRRLWVVAVKKPAPWPMLRQLGFRVMGKWQRSDIWLWLLKR
jgi:mannosyltransferase